MAEEELVWGEWFRWHWLRYTYLVAAALFDVLVAAEIRFLGPHPPPPWVLALAAALLLALATGEGLLYRCL